ncbi:MAG: ABC transporter ATP-binding protein/permease [Lachnospiraceae bacterium]|nr:ABC transporter ATP-binding protein/permease [Lachnospiraceae bacterium]
MFKILKYLGEFKLSVIAVILLLILQAYCDLSLPSYTSDIVDVGIEQSGIESAVPDIISEETFESVCLFSEDEDLIRQHYSVNEDGNFELQTADKETMNALDEAIGVPMVMVSMLRSSDEAMVSNAMMSKEQALGMKYQMLEQYGEELSDMIVSQMAIMAVKTEYESLGIDLSSIQTQYLLTTGAKMLMMTVLMIAAAIAVGFLAARTSAGIGMRLRNRVFRKVVSFSHAEMDKFSTASLITRSTNDIQQVQMVSVMLLRMVCYAPILGIGGIVKVANTRTGMGWIIAVAVVVILLLVGTLMGIAMPKFKLMQTLVDKLNLVSREILTGIPVIRAFSREKYEEKRFDRANNELMSTQLFTNRVMTFMMPAMMLIMNGIAIAIVWFGAKGIDLGNLQLGDMMAFITYSMQIVMSFLMLTMISVMLPRAGVAAERIEEVLHTEPTILDAQQVKDGSLEEKGIVAFENVCFRYPEAEEDALSDISFVAEPGKTTAIIGSTGCGKSTLLHLITRFYDVTGGRITLDGIDIRELSQKKLRSMIGFVPQKGVLFSGTIASNIKFVGEDKVSDEVMKEAADIAQAVEFIESKDEGFKSPIAQGGTNVSGGQKQRLSIARAIAAKPKVFLFDDSFSALDYKTDAVLRKALHEKISDAAVIIVAQRISTILHADQIIVLDDGKIAGIGVHEELLKDCAAYQEIARSQLSESEMKGGRS